MKKSRTPKIVGKQAPSDSPKRLYSNFRQLLYPPEFRIQRYHLAEELDQADNPATHSRNPTPDSKSNPLYDNSLLVEIATNLWRMHIKMVDLQTGEPLEETRRLFRHLNAIKSALEEAGITIQDHTGVSFDSGMQISVIAFQPHEHLDRERIIETIKPSIYYRRKMMQMGQVIVGVPSNPELSSDLNQPTGGAPCRRFEPDSEPGTNTVGDESKTIRRRSKTT